VLILMITEGGTSNVTLLGIMSSDIYSLATYTLGIANYRNKLYIVRVT